MLGPLAQEADAKQIGGGKLVFQGPIRVCHPTFNEPLTVVHSPFLVIAVSSPHPRHFSRANLPRLLPNPSPALTAVSTEQTLLSYIQRNRHSFARGCDPQSIFLDPKILVH
jgi:hypothetical protein